MFANTLSVTIGTDSARTLTRINQDSFGSTYRLATALELTELVIRNSTSKESNLLYDRHNANFGIQCMRLTCFRNATMWRRPPSKRADRGLS